MVTIGSIRLTVRLVRWLIKWLRERKTRKGATTLGAQEQRAQEQTILGQSMGYWL